MSARDGVVHRKMGQHPESVMGCVLPITTRVPCFKHVFQARVSSTANEWHRAASQSSYIVIAWDRVVVANDQNFWYRKDSPLAQRGRTNGCMTVESEAQQRL